MNLVKIFSKRLKIIYSSKKKKAYCDYNIDLLTACALKEN